MKHELHYLIFFRDRIEPAVLTNGLPNDHSTPSVDCRITPINGPTKQNNNNNDINEFRTKSKKTFKNALPQVELFVLTNNSNNNIIIIQNIETGQKPNLYYNL